MLVSCIPRNYIDIENIVQREKGASKYRGSVNIPKENYSIKVTKNGWVYIFIRNSFNLILQDIEKFVSHSCSDILFLDLDPQDILVKVDLVNIQISIDISLEQKSIKFVQLFIYLQRQLRSKYQFKIKESNTFESLWLKYDEILHSNIIFLSSFRIVHSHLTFTLSHNLKGSCITKDPALFLQLCSEINTAISHL